MPQSSSPSFLLKVRSRFKALPRSAISRFPQIASPEKADRVIFFAPHPDDEALAAGGYLRRAIEKGAFCYVVLVTDGNRRGLKDVREKEFENVLAHLGIAEGNTSKLNYPNGAISKEDSIKLVEEIEDILEKVKPTVVIAPHPSDLHREHILVSEQLKAHHDKSPTYSLLQYLIHYPPHYPWPRSFSPHSPLLPPTNLTLRGENWQLFPLMDEEVSKKKELVELYPSQLKTPILRSLMYSLIRQNELFLVYPKS